MEFDFALFSKIAGSVYTKDNLFTLEQCLMVFRCYFQTYEKYMKRPHPPICAEQIGRIMWLMPWVCVDDIGGYYPDIDPEYYESLINLHFKTRYRHCDFNINHFFSGRIRELRFYEAETWHE